MRARAAVTAALLGLLTTGCESAPYSIFRPGGQEAQVLAWIGWGLVGLTVTATVVVFGLFLYAALRKKGSLEEHEPIDIDHGKSWILIGGVAISGGILVILFFVTVFALRWIPGEVAEPDLEIQVTGHQWWWEVDYLYDELPDRFSTANEIHIPVGRKVMIHLQSADVIHSFWVPRLHGKTDAIPGHTNHLLVEAEEPGIYWGECAEFCGVQHAHMRFTVVAEPEEEYLAWVDRMREPADSVTDPLLVQGRDIFMQNACNFCHRIRGTEALGGVAPDLTHVASRAYIGAGLLPNTRARMQAWVVNAQQLKPGIHMPSLDVFTGEELNALTAYLMSLE